MAAAIRVDGAYEPNYLGEQLATKGAVVVSIAYRLGVFGFFSHPELSTANFALLDQIAALQWIKNNISMVGGDPDNVTVAGESAGASNIAYLMASPKAAGLFNRAIHQSAGWALYGTASKQETDYLGLQLAKVSTDSADSNIEELRNLQATKILDAAEKVYADHFFDVVVDFDSVTKRFIDSVTNGELAPVDLMIGTNANESRMYLPEGASVRSWLAASDFDADTTQSLLTLLDSQGQGTDLERLDRLATSYNYTCPSMALARANSIQTISKSGKQTWFYNFTKVRDGELATKMGAYHGAELPYMFNTHDNWLPTSEQDLALTQVMTDYWFNFASTGNPNFGAATKQSTLPAWQPYSADNARVQFLGLEVKSASHPSEQLCKIMEK